MWKYVKSYLACAITGGLFMVGEVLMDLVQPRLMGVIVDDGVLGLENGGVSDLGIIWHAGLLMIVLTLIGGFCGSMNNVFVHIATQNMGNGIRKDCFRRIMSFSFPQMDRFGTGSLVTRVTNDVTQVQTLISTFVRGLIRTCMLTFGSMYCLFRLNLKFGLCMLCAFPLLTGCVAFCLAKGNPLFTRLQGHLDRINAIMQEDISGIRVIKACVREGYEKLRFGKANGELVKTQLRVLVIFAFMNPAAGAMMYLATAALLFLGAHEVRLGGATPGAVMQAVTYTTQMLNGILMLVMLFQNISRGIASWKRVKEILNSRPDLEDGPFGGECRIRGKIEFRDVSFTYPGGVRPVLEHIDLTICPGETVAIMGATGCGKTTLASLIPRFYDVASGAVLVDGVDVREYQQRTLREKTAVVLQKAELFSASIEENIAWGRPGAGHEEIVSAAKTAQADGFISAGPEGYGTAVAERGMSLSGGQKQRLSIARAVLKEAEILILDDATSALDLKTEASLYHALDANRRGMTKIIIAQRVASVRRADRIVVLDGGKIAAVGSHDELRRSCPIYEDICRSQLEEEADIHG